MSRAAAASIGIFSRRLCFQRARGSSCIGISGPRYPGGSCSTPPASSPMRRRWSRSSRGSAGADRKRAKRSPGPEPETVAAIPLTGRDGSILGVLLVSSSQRELSALVSRIRWSGVAFGALGIVFGFAVSYVLASRVTRPVEQLADAARAMAGGDWNVRSSLAHGSARESPSRPSVRHHDDGSWRISAIGSCRRSASPRGASSRGGWRTS